MKNKYIKYLCNKFLLKLKPFKNNNIIDPNLIELKNIYKQLIFFLDNYNTKYNIIKLELIEKIDLTNHNNLSYSENVKLTNHNDLSYSKKLDPINHNNLSYSEECKNEYIYIYKYKDIKVYYHNKYGVIQIDSGLLDINVMAMENIRNMELEKQICYLEEFLSLYVDLDRMCNNCLEYFCDGEYTLPLIRVVKDDMVMCYHKKCYNGD